ncbi:MAG: hypothetical protein ABIG37_03125 [Nanoarchaeota archaeon]
MRADKADTPQTPDKFCEYQREYEGGNERFVCAIFDEQCSKPFCSYTSKQEMPKKGCDIANCRGMESGFSRFHASQGLGGMCFITQRGE